jgi:hypothetical protein
MKLLEFALIVGLVFAMIPLSKVIAAVDATTLMTLIPIADACVDSSNLESNFGFSDYLYATFWDYDYTDDVRLNSYLMFNLGSLSLGEVSSASLRLYAWSAKSPTAHVGAHQCFNTTWNEKTINWLNAPSFSPFATDTVAVPFKDQWYSWNVTEPVKNAAGSKLTLVLSVKDIGERYDTYFYSREGWHNPELVVEFKDVTHDVAISNIDPYRTILCNRTMTCINITVTNLGNVQETFTVIVSHNSTAFGSQMITVGNGSSFTSFFRWNTTGVNLGNYTIAATIGQLPGETDTSDNSLSSMIQVSILGDINGDGKVDMRDVSKVAAAFQFSPSYPKWVCNGDLDENGVIDMNDINTTAKHFGERYP